MAKCKDCIHGEICDMFAHTRTLICTDRADKMCKMFKPKSEVVEILDKLDRFINSNCIEIKDKRGIKGYVTSGVHFAIAEFKNRYIPQNANRCVVCGEIIPEGRQVCPKCQIEKGD